jgi:hypothetical protein
MARPPSGSFFTATAHLRYQDLGRSVARVSDDLTPQPANEILRHLAKEYRLHVARREAPSLWGSGELELKVLFLMGPGHCGSTLLDLLLGSHSRGFSLGEIYRLGRVLHDQPGRAPRICGVCPEHCEFWNERVPLWQLRILYRHQNLALRAVSRLARLGWNPYRLMAEWSGRDILVDSSKHPQWIHRQLRSSSWRDIEPHLVYLLRDGRAVVSSYFRKYPERGLDAVALDWRARVDRMNQYYQDFDRGSKLKVRYEDLASDPEATLRALCGSVGMDFEPGMLAFWDHNHHHIMGNGGTRSMIFRHRLQQAESKRMPIQRRMEEAKQHYAHDYYDRTDIGIRLDERWKRELSAEQLDVFERIAGETNAALNYERQAA